MKIGVIGAAGKMAGAIICAIQNDASLSAQELYLSDRDNAALQEAFLPYTKRGATVCADNVQLAELCDFIILAVKPQLASEVLGQIAGVMSADKCLISIAAGVRIESISQQLRGACERIVRVMPNTPLMLGQGASALCRSAAVSDEQFSFCKSIFGASGIAVECEEQDINTVTAVSGSGPAYVFRFAKAVVDECVQLGLDNEIASALMIQTLIGSAYMLRDSGKTPQQLIDMVTSPKGTTLAALESMSADDFDGVVASAVRACKLRADELGKS